MPARGGKRPGAGRPSVLGPDTINAVVKLPAKTVRAIDREAKREGINRSEWLRRAVSKAMPTIRTRA